MHFELTKLFFIYCKIFKISLHKRNLKIMIFLDKLVFSRHKMFEDWCICDQGRIYVPAATNPSRTHLIYPKAMLVLLKTDCVQMVPSCSRAWNRFFNRPRLERGSRKSPEQLLKSIKVSRLWSLKQVRFRDLLPIKREHPLFFATCMRTWILLCSVVLLHYELIAISRPIEIFHIVEFIK